MHCVVWECENVVVTASLCCVLFQETFRCRNHIRHFGVLKGRNPETLALCGTYSIFRACSYIEVGSVHKHTTQLQRHNTV